MSSIEKRIDFVKAQAAKVCEEYNLSFIGFFQNANRSYERVILEGMDSTTPNGSFSSLSFNNLSASSEIQSALANLINPNKIVTSSPKNASSEVNTSLSSSSSYKLLSKSRPYKIIMIDPHNKVEVKNYLYNCFEEFQQIPCKLLSKAWIKVIEPKKQSKYPYKQGESSKPYWWPPNCIHREPDHLKKDERISLLINILRIFKQRESELVYTASLIKGLGPSNKKITRSDNDFSQRRMDILEDMFKVVNAQHEFNVKNLKVIKPGKKYSSLIYQQNKPKYSIPESSQTISKFDKTPKPENLIRFPDLLATPPSLKAPSLIRNGNKLLPPPQFSNHYEPYNEFIDCISNRSDSEKGATTFGHHSTNHYNPLLSSPFTPSNIINNKYPTPQYTNSNSNIQPPMQSLHQTTQIREQSNSINPLIQQNDSLMMNEPAIDPTLFSNPLVSTASKAASPSKLFKPLDCSVSPPSGIFVPPKNNSPSNNALNTLNSSRMNSINSELDRASKRNCLFTTFSVSKSKYGGRESFQEHTKENEGDETDYE